jgi:hypothetical protein
MTKPVLYTLITSVGMTAALGVLVVFLDNWSWFGERILGTAVTISIAGLCALSCAALRERKHMKVLPVSGLALTLVGASLVIGALWFDINNGAYWTLTVCAAAFAVATSYLALLAATPKGKKYIPLLAGALFILYNLVSGGGYLVEKTDSLSTLNGVAEAKLTDGASVWLAETPTSNRFCVPFVFYYVRKTYPFHLRFNATGDGNTAVTDHKRLAGLSQLSRFNPDYKGPPISAMSCLAEYHRYVIVVTEVLYHRKPDDSQVTNNRPVFKVSSWDEIVITEPGEWIVESNGYVRNKSGETKQLTFPTMTIRPTESGRMRVWRGVSYVIAGIMAIT